MSQASIKGTATKLLALSVLMFGFGYALVPIYNVFCEVTGFNGKTGVVSADVVAAMEVDRERTVTVAFDTNTREIPWEFQAVEKKVSVHPGEMGEATFIVENRSAQKIVGRAIPSVAPAQASIYFNKTECFCFDEQVMEPGEIREMKVRFVVDTDLPKRFSALTLSYTFFALPEQDKLVKSGANDEQTRI